MSKSRHTPRAPDPVEAAPATPSRDRIDPYAAMRENRDPTPEEIHAWVHAHDPIPLRDRIHPMHGPYETIPRDEDGSIHSWFFCTPEEIEALQAIG